MKTMNGLTALLVIVGALNWGLVAIARFDLVAALGGLRFGEVSALTSGRVWPGRSRRALPGGLVDARARARHAAGVRSRTLTLNHHGVHTSC